MYPPSTPAEEQLNTVESSQGISKFKKWLQIRTTKNNKNPTLHGPDLVPKKSRRPADDRSRSQSPGRVDTTNEGPSRIAAGIRVRVSTLP